MSINNTKKSEEEKEDFDFLDEKDAICTKVFKIRGFSVFLVPFNKNKATNFNLVGQVNNELFQSNNNKINIIIGIMSSTNFNSEIEQVMIKDYIIINPSKHLHNCLKN